MAQISFVCGVLVLVGGVLLFLQENATLGALAALAGVGLLVFGAWVLSRERRHTHRGEHHDKEEAGTSGN